MSAVRILPTVTSDIAPLTLFINASWIRTYAPLIGADMATELATNKHTSQLFEREIDASDALSWVAKTTVGKIVGHVGGFEKGNGAIYIDRFHISPEWFGKGVASLLDKAVAGDAEQKGYQYLELTVLEDNARALAFYLKAGFSIDESRSPVEGLGPKQALTLVKPTSGSDKG
ncbi:MAG: GNAT family N-acetyltransferase [Pseudomonadota bacterium]